jgi:hypothetical protein
MKSLKKELIDTLRSLLADEPQPQPHSQSQNQEEIAPEAALCSSVPLPDPTVSIESTTVDSGLSVPPPSPAPTRSSLLLSMRCSLTSATVPEESEEIKAHRIASEFEARKSRAHGRESIAAKSDDVASRDQIEEEIVPVLPLAPEPAPITDEVAPNSFVSPEKSSFQPFDISVVDESAPAISQESDIQASADDCMVISPAKSAEQDSSSSPTDEVVDADAVDDKTSANWSPVSESSCGASSVPSETIVSQIAALPLPPPPQKKPLNLVSSVQTSFLPGTKAKPIIPSLQKAAILKDQEAAKALQREAERKKKEMEKKCLVQKVPSVPTSMVGPSNVGIGTVKSAGLPTGMSGIMKSSVLPTKLASTISTTAVANTGKPTLSAPAPAPVPAATKPVKTGLFGLLKKTFTPNKTVPPVSISAPAPVPKEGDSSVADSAQESIPPKTLFATVDVESTIGLSTAQMVSATAPPVASVVSMGGGAVKEQKEEPMMSPERAEQYPIDDGDSSGSDSGTDDEDKEDRKKNQIPQWARGNDLKEALERQFGFHGHTPVDPDTIFFEVSTCNLEEIFGQKEGKFGSYAKRNSTGKWDADELSLVEKRKYRSQMGYAAATPMSLVL